MNIVGQNHGRLPLLESLLSVVGRATREEDSFGSYRKNLKRLFPRRRTGEGAIDGIVGIGVLAALEKGELTCELLFSESLLLLPMDLSSLARADLFKNDY